MSDPNPFIGRTIAGRYRIQRLLGEGGMATVWVAEQDDEPHEVALKIMNDELTRDRTFVRRFEREAKAASLVVHDSSVKILSWGVDAKLPYIAMELIAGDDLYLLLDRDGPIGQARAARILAEVCDALEVAHGLGIVHRDLKPENIMVVPAPDRPSGERVKVLDFGIAKLVAPELIAQERPRREGDDENGPSSGLTQAGTLIGTPAYMSPEQCNLQAVDARSDVYTCGVLLYQLLTGSLPFEGEAPLHTAMLHIHEPLRPPHEIATNLDRRLEAVIIKALEKKPEKRFQRAAELGSTLRALAASLPDRPAIAPGSKKKPVSSSRRAASLPAMPRRFPETLRWNGGAPGTPDPDADEEEAAATPLESKRTLIANAKAADEPVSVRVKGDQGGAGGPKPRHPADGDQDKDGDAPTPKNDRASQTDGAAAEPEAASDDRADRAKTLVREAEEPSSSLMSRPRSGPKGTEVMQLPVVSLTPDKKREIKPTLRSADSFLPNADGAPAGVEIRLPDDAQAESARMRTEDDPAGQAVTLDAEARMATLPMGVRRVAGGGVADLMMQPTLPRRGAPIATLELTEQPRVVEPFPIAYPRRPRGSGLTQMSGARVLFLGFLAGAVLMAIVGVIYFYILR